MKVMGYMYTYSYFCLTFVNYTHQGTPPSLFTKTEEEFKQTQSFFSFSYLYRKQRNGISWCTLFFDQNSDEILSF